MMGLALDQTQNAKLDCASCDLGLMSLRNCGGRFKAKSRSPIVVNDEPYWICPKSMTFNRKEESQLLEIYFACRENNTFPYGNSPLQQTAFCLDAFKHLDGIVGDYQAKKQKEHEAKMNKLSKK